jgi:hypothetical protein
MRPTAMLVPVGSVGCPLRICECSSHDDARLGLKRREKMGSYGDKIQE